MGEAGFASEHDHEGGALGRVHPVRRACHGGIAGQRAVSAGPGARSISFAVRRAQDAGADRVYTEDRQTTAELSSMKSQHSFCFRQHRSRSHVRAHLHRIQVSRQQPMRSSSMNRARRLSMVAHCLMSSAGCQSSSFPELPDAVAEMLEPAWMHDSRRPTRHTDRRMWSMQASTVPARLDWAVLCSTHGNVELLVFFARAPDKPSHWPQLRSCNGCNGTIPPAFLALTGASIRLHRSRFVRRRQAWNTIRRCSTTTPWRIRC